MEKRVSAIVDANKWLAGRMCYKTSPPVPLGPEPTQELLNVTIAVPLKVADPSLYFKTVSMPTLRPNTPPGEITQMLTESGLTIKPGFMVLDKDEPLFRIMLITITDDMFAIVPNLSHNIADGHVMYQLFGMLSPNNEVRSLKWERSKRVLHEIVEAKADLMGPKRNAVAREHMKTNTITPMVLGVLGNMICKKFPTMTIRLVNAEWLEKQKAELMKNKPSHLDRISTNDILTSWFYKTAQVKWGMMAYNLRGKASFGTTPKSDTTSCLAEIDDEAAGSYFSMLSFTPAEFDSPYGIRSRVSQYDRIADEPGKPPGCLDSIKGLTGVITNWSHLYVECDLSKLGCEQILHLPVGQPMEMGKFRCGCYIFTPVKGKLAVLTFDREGIFAKESEALGDSIDGLL